MSVRRSIAWTYTAQAIGFAIAFGSTVVIARLVSPRDFGIFAMANAITIIINVLMQFGLAKYIMRETDVSRNFLRTVSTVNVIMTFVYVGAILLGSYAAVGLFGSPEVGRFLTVFAIYPLLAMFEFVPAALCSREMRFREIALMSVLRAVVMAASTILLALEGYGYMSFAWAQVLSWAATAIGFNIMVWRPDVWKPRFAGIGSVLHFGSQMIGISGVGQLSARGSEMALGSLLGLASLGLYTRASNIPTLLHLNIYGAGSNVIFSRLAQDLREHGAFHETYLRFMRVMLGLLWPMMLGIAVLAQPLINILYGARWQAAATPLSLLTVAAAITVAIGMNSEVFILRRETQRQVKIEIIKSVIGFVLFAGGAAVSLVLAATAKVVEAIIGYLLYRRPMTRLVGGADGDLRRIYAESLLLTAGATMPALLLMFWCGWSPTTPPLLIVAAIALGVLIWLALLLTRHHPIVSEARRVFGRS